MRIMPSAPRPAAAAFFISKIDLRKGRSRALNKMLPGDRQPDAIRLTLEQRHAELVLERLYAPADGRLLHAENSSRSTETRLIRDHQRLGYGDKIDYGFASCDGRPTGRNPKVDAGVGGSGPGREST